MCVCRKELQRYFESTSETKWKERGDKKVNLHIFSPFKYYALQFHILTCDYVSFYSVSRKLMVMDDIRMDQFSRFSVDKPEYGFPMPTSLSSSDSPPKNPFRFPPPPFFIPSPRISANHPTFELGESDNSLTTGSASDIEDNSDSQSDAAGLACSSIFSSDHGSHCRPNVQKESGITVLTLILLSPLNILAFSRLYHISLFHLQEVSQILALEEFLGVAIFKCDLHQFQFIVLFIQLEAMKVMAVLLAFDLRQTSCHLLVFFGTLRTARYVESLES